MRKVTVLASIALGVVVVLLTYKVARAFVVHGYEDKTAARVISTYRVVSETQATSGSFQDLAESLEQLEFDDPKGHAEYLLSDGDPVEVVVTTGAFDDPLSYAVAAYSGRDWLNLGERPPHERLSSARWLVIDNQWVKWMEHGKHRSVGNVQGLIAEFVARPNLAIPGDRDPRERGSRPLNSNRWRGAAPPQRSGSYRTPVVRRGAGQQVVRADLRLVGSHASVRALLNSAAQLPDR